MELRAYADADLALTEALETDPGVMAQLGGPIPPARLPEIHRRRLGGDSDHHGEHVHETGWMVLTNAPSNALCRKAGFALRGETDVVYAGRTLHCNHWALDLRA
jgi:hypothetical protein